MTFRSIAILKLIVTFLDCSSARNQMEYNLLQNLLFTNYSNTVRPVMNYTEPVTVWLDVVLTQIVEMDERNQILKLNVWMRSNWKDVQMMWDPDEWDGIKQVHIEHHLLWKHDITVYNAANSGEDGKHIYNLPVDYDGSVFWFYPTLLKVTCLLDVTYFPWDQQLCHIKFGSWSYHAWHLNLLNMTDHMDLTYFVPSGEWDLVAAPLRRNIVYYNCCKEPYVDVTYWLVLRRKPLYYVFNMILPSVFITATTIMVFYLPVESGEKVSLGVTVLLAMTVFLMIIAEIMPPQSMVIPLIAQYFGATIMMLATSTVVSVTIISLHHRGVYGLPPSKLVKNVVLVWLASILRLQDRVKAYSKQPHDVNNIDMGMMHEKHFDRSDKPDYIKEWEMVAMVIDRMCLIIYTVVLSVITIVLLSKHLFDDNSDYMSRINNYNIVGTV